MGGLDEISWLPHPKARPAADPVSSQCIQNPATAPPRRPCRLPPTQAQKHPWSRSASALRSLSRRWPEGPSETVSLTCAFFVRPSGHGHGAHSGGLPGHPRWTAEPLPPSGISAPGPSDLPAAVSPHRSASCQGVCIAPAPRAPGAAWTACALCRMNTCPRGGQQGPDAAPPGLAAKGLCFPCDLGRVVTAPKPHPPPRPQHPRQGATVGKARTCRPLTHSLSPWPFVLLQAWTCARPSHGPTNQQGGKSERVVGQVARAGARARRTGWERLGWRLRWTLLASPQSPLTRDLAGPPALLPRPLLLSP